MKLRTHISIIYGHRPYVTMFHAKKRIKSILQDKVRTTLFRAAYEIEKYF